MVEEYSPSFEDMYPMNEDALYEDFYDALVNVVYCIENLLKNYISTSSVWELNRVFQKLADLGMPKPGILNEKHQKVWKETLMKTDNLQLLSDSQSEQDASEDNLIKKPLDGMFYTPEEQRYKNNKMFSHWNEHKNFIKNHFKSILPELKMLQKMLIKPEKTAGTNGQETESEIDRLRGYTDDGLKQTKKDCDIPPECQTKPMSKKQMAGFFGVSIKKFNKMIATDAIYTPFEISRQTFIFDTRKYSKSIIDALEKEGLF